MYSHVRLPIQPSLILTRLHLTAHGSLLIAYLTLPISAWLYVVPLAVLQAHLYLKLKRKRFLFQKPRLLELNQDSIILTIAEQRPFYLYNFQARALWPSFVILQYQDDQAQKGLMWLHQTETNAEAFRKLKVMGTIGQLEQDTKRVL